MRKYTWEEIKKENGVYKTFCEDGYRAINSKIGLFDFHSQAGEITVLNHFGGEMMNDIWNREIFVKIEG